MWKRKSVGFHLSGVTIQKRSQDTGDGQTIDLSYSSRQMSGLVTWKVDLDLLFWHDNIHLNHQCHDIFATNGFSGMDNMWEMAHVSAYSLEAIIYLRVNEKCLKDTKLSID